MVQPHGGPPDGTPACPEPWPEPVGVTTELSAVAQLGPFFAVTTGAITDSAWRPVRTLYDEPAVLASVLSRVASTVDTAEQRVAASIFLQAYAARLWSIGLGALTRTSCVPDLRVANVAWRDQNGSIRLHLVRSVGWRSGDLPSRLADMVLGEHLAQLISTTCRLTGLPDRLLWDNSASAVSGTAGLLEAGPAGRARSLAERLLTRHPDGGSCRLPDGRYRRRSCCLYYRTAGGGVCGDCVFNSPPGSSQGGTRRDDG